MEDTVRLWRLAVRVLLALSESLGDRTGGRVSDISDEIDGDALPADALGEGLLLLVPLGVQVVVSVLEVVAVPRVLERLELEVHVCSAVALPQLQDGEVLRVSAAEGAETLNVILLGVTTTVAETVPDPAVTVCEAAADRLFDALRLPFVRVAVPAELLCDPVAVSLHDEDIVFVTDVLRDLVLVATVIE